MTHSTRGWCSSNRLVMPPPLLTRQEFEVKSLEWDYRNGKAILLKSVLIVVKNSPLQVLTPNDVNPVDLFNTRKHARSAGIGRTRKRGTTKEEEITITGKEGHHLTCTKGLHMDITERCVSIVERKQPQYTIKMRTGATTPETTWSPCVNDVTSYSIIVQATYQKKLSSNRNPVFLAKNYSNPLDRDPSSVTPVEADTRNLKLRYSQVLQETEGKPLNYGKAKNRLAAELGFLDEMRELYPDAKEGKIKYLAGKKAQELINKYFDSLPGAYKFIQRTYYEAAHEKYVESYLGRRRWIPQIMDWEDQELHTQEANDEGKDMCWCSECKLSRDGDRKTVNSRIQTTAADIIMLAMIKIDNDVRLKEIGAKLLLQVHDELVLECPEEHVEEVMQIVQYHMENPGVHLRVPLRAEPNSGDNWMEAK